MIFIGYNNVLKFVEYLSKLAPLLKLLTSVFALQSILSTAQRPIRAFHSSMIVFGWMEIIVRVLRATMF